MDASIESLLGKIGWNTIKKGYQYFLRNRFRKPIGHFVTPEIYYAPYLGEKEQLSLITHAFKCVGREMELNAIIDDVNSGLYNVFVITAPPGYGKSKFALELARLLRGDSHGPSWRLRQWIKGHLWNIYFVQQYTSDILEYVNELRKTPRIAIFIDNAHENPELVRALSTYAGSSHEQGRLLLFCFCRSSISNIVYDALPSVQLGRIRDLCLRKLNKSDISDIVSERLPAVRESQRERIVEFTKDSVFLTTLVCQLIKKGMEFSEAITDRQFRRKICDEPLNEATNLCNVPFYKVSRTLAVLAAASPVNYLDRDVKEVACKLGDISLVEYECLVQQAQLSGLFSTFARNLIKPTPNLVGDLILDTVCINDDNSISGFTNELLTSLLPKYSRNVLNNLADLGLTIGLTETIDVVTPVLKAEKGQIFNYSIFEIENVLDRISPLAIRRAESIINILKEIWTRAEQIIASHDAQSEEWKRLMGNVVPLLVAATRNPIATESAMEILKSLILADGVRTPYDNHKPERALEEVVSLSPFRPVEHTSRTLEIIEKWFSIGSIDAVIALKSITELLSPYVQWTESDALRITFKTSQLNLTEQVREMRRRAINLVVSGLRSSERDIQKTAFDITDSIGRYRYGPPYDENSQIAKIITEEKKQIVSVLKSLLEKGVSFSVCRRIEERLWNWWCFSNDEVAKDCEDVLAKIDNSSHYRMYKFLYSSDLPISLSVEELRERGDKSRADYFFSERREEKELSKDTLEDLLVEFGIGDERAVWASLFKDLFAEDDAMSWRSYQLFHSLAILYPNTGWFMVKSDDSVPWSNGKTSMLNALKKQDKTRWGKELRNKFDQDIANVAEVLLWLTSLDWKDGLDDYQWYVVEKSVAFGDRKIRRTIANQLSHGSSSHWEKSTEFMLKLSSEDTTDEEIIDDFFSCLVHNRPIHLKSSLCEIDEAALDFLLRKDLSEYIPWDRPYWCGEYLGFVSSVKPERFLNFVETSLLDEKAELRHMHISILGARNAGKAFDKLLRNELRRFYIHNFVTWAYRNDVLGEFARALLSAKVSIRDDDFRDELERLYQSRNLTGIARIISHYTVSKQWLEEVKRLLTEADMVGENVFEEVQKLLAHCYWVGTTSRSLGQPTERDRDCSEICGIYMSDNTLSARVREYFRTQKQEADKRIRSDIARDEAIAGERLD